MQHKSIRPSLNAKTYDIKALNSFEVKMENKIIELTEKAKTHIRNIYKQEKMEEGACLRIGVVGGGCSGFSYSIKFDDQRDRDNIQEFDEIKIAIDPKSSVYLKGVVLDFRDGLTGKGLVFINPNATNTCGCGESFSV
jgi:iron-sulfur cluster assembly protein